MENWISSWLRQCANLGQSGKVDKESCPSCQVKSQAGIEPALFCPLLPESFYPVQLITVAQQIVALPTMGSEAEHKWQEHIQSLHAPPVMQSSRTAP